ncbi:hypothetical protein [Microbacterium deminutum]|uniref:PKD domain-containing protein n=1 Tax=Microbacterium deminutum TaxID=344164 RepID=A0ABP5BNH0_9MICO
MSNSGTQVDVGASTTTPGSGASHPHNDHHSPVPPVIQNPAVPAPDSCPLDRCDLPYDVVSPPDVTLADLASFRPDRPSLSGEPAGFGVVGMPANLVAAASEQHIRGTLLGWDVTVRFVPAGFVFEYGDGSTARTPTGGATWQRLGQAQFTPTVTSHVYAARGTYPVSAMVQYSASVDFGSGTWRPVEGYVTAASGGYDVRVLEVRTALVDKTCAENPHGPGC